MFIKIFICRVIVTKLNEQRQIVYSKQSEILKISLTKGEEIQIMSFDRNIEYPIIISANILYTSPETQDCNPIEERQQSIC